MRAAEKMYPLFVTLMAWQKCVTCVRGFWGKRKMQECRSDLEMLTKYTDWPQLAVLQELTDYKDGN